MRKVIVINAKDVDSANEFCNSIGAQGDTFTVQLFDSNNVLAGYWCGWNMTDQQYEAIFNNQMFMLFDTPQEALDKTGWHTQTIEGE